MGLKPKLVRHMGLFTVIATGVSSMVGASINVVPFMIHRGHNTQKQLLYQDQQITVNLKAGVPFTHTF